MNIADTIKADLQIAWGAVEGEVVKDAGIVWNDFKGIIGSLLPQEYTALKQVIADEIVKLESGTAIGDIESAVLNAAEHLGLDFLTKLGGGVLQAIIAVVKVP